MRTSGQGVRFIQSYEKCSLTVYNDEGGRPTIGYGHLIKPGEDYGAGITQADADTLFLADLTRCAEVPLADAVDVQLGQAEYDACVSLCYNIGAGNFTSSSLVRMLNAGNTAGAADQFLRWDHVHGVVSDGLRARRAAERDIFLNGNYVNHV